MTTLETTNISIRPNVWVEFEKSEDGSVSKGLNVIPILVKDHIRCANDLASWWKENKQFVTESFYELEAPKTLMLNFGPGCNNMNYENAKHVMQLIVNLEIPQMIGLRILHNTLTVNPNVTYIAGEHRHPFPVLLYMKNGIAMFGCGCTHLPIETGLKEWAESNNIKGRGISSDIVRIAFDFMAEMYADFGRYYSKQNLFGDGGRN